LHGKPHIPTMKFGVLHPVPIRDLWPHEERDFTPWLCEHLADLGEVLGLDVELVGREVDVGGFFLDILAREVGGTGRAVVIENQFGLSNHDHLGKLLTYAGGRSASVLVWIAELIRDEHRQALEWLNEHTDESTWVFGLELTAFRIDDSQPVFQFRPVVTPNNWAKESRVLRPQGEASENQLRYQAFFQRLIDELRDTHHFTNARKGQAQSWYSFSSGSRGVKYGAFFTKDSGMVTEIYLDGGDKDRNKRLFDALYEQREGFDRAFGQPLDWQRLEHRQASRICIRTEGSIAGDESQWDRQLQWMVNHLLRLKQLWEKHMKAIAERHE
jgi:Domain of unknown function (DUF4268)